MSSSASSSTAPAAPNANSLPPPPVPKIISFYNHKGGVGKSTLLMHLSMVFSRGWHRQDQNGVDVPDRVLVVDCDSQINQTSFLLEFSRRHGYPHNPTAEAYFDQCIEGTHQRNLYRQLRFAMAYAPLDNQSCLEIANNLFLLPGHPDIQELEVQIAMGIDFPDKFPAGAESARTFRRIVTHFAQLNRCTYVFLDLGPSIGLMNQNILLSSDYFILPCSPDAYTKWAVRALGHYLQNWLAAHAHYRNSPDGQGNALQWPGPQFLGYSYCDFSLQRKKGTAGDNRPSLANHTFQEDLEPQVLRNFLNNALLQHGCVCPFLVPFIGREDGDAKTAIRLGEVSDFNMLSSVSQLSTVPVFDIGDPEMMAATGYTAGSYKKQIAAFKAEFTRIAQLVLTRTA